MRKGCGDFPNREMRIPTVRQGCAFSPRVRTAAVLAILSNLNIRRSWCPRFFESGDIFSSPILKKRQKNVRCIVEGFLKISRIFFRTKGKNMSVCYMEGKFFALPPNLQEFCPLESERKPLARQNRDRPHHFVRWKVERAIWSSAQRLFRRPRNFFEKSGTKPVSDSLS